MKIAVLFLTLVASLGPAMSATALKPLPQDFDPIGSDDCVVIGRLDFHKEGKEPKPHGKVGPMGTPTITLKNDDAGQSYRITVTPPDWVFYVALPPGKYRVTRWVGGNLTIYPEAEFEVAPCKVENPTEQQAATCSLTYVGLLKFVQSGSLWNHFKAGPDRMPGKLEVVDEYAEAMKAFNERYSHLTCDGRTSLFRLPEP